MLTSKNVPAREGTFGGLKLILSLEKATLKKPSLIKVKCFYLEKG